MKIRNIVAFILITLMLASMTACIPGKKSKLSIVYMDDDINTKNFAVKYLRENKESNIRGYSFGQMGQIEQRLTSGDIPDVVIIPYSSLSELSKYMEAGVFCDINELIKKYKGLDLSAYNKKILDSGICNGKRYIMPLNYSVNVLATTKDIMEKNSIETDWSKLSKEKLKDIAKKYKEQNPDSYLFDSLSFYGFIAGSYEPFINTKNKQAEFNTSRYSNLVQGYSDLKQSIMPISMYLDMTANKEKSDLLKNSKIAVSFTPVTKLSDLYKPYSSFNRKVEPVILPVPSGDDKFHVTAMPQSFIAISEKCNNKEAAFNVVKALLSDEYQENDDAYGLPVNNKAFIATKEKMLKNQSNRNAGCKSDETIESLFMQFDKIVNSIDIVNDIDFKLALTLQNIIDGSVKQNSDLNNIANLLQSKTNEYFSEKLVTKEADASNDDSLSIYYMDVFPYVSNAISTFGNKYKNIKLKEKVFTGIDSMDEFSLALSTEILSGGGPDIIVFSPGRNFDSASKAFESDAFADLNPLISNDKDFKLSDYRSSIAKAGIFNGKRLFLPIYYQLPSLFTTESILKENNINISDDCTLKDLNTIVEQFKNNKSKKSKYLLDMNMNISISTLMNFTNIEFIDYKNKKCNLNSNDFKEILKIYKNMQPVIATDEVEQKYEYNPLKMLKGNIIAIGIDITGNADSIFGNNTLIKHDLGQDMKIIRVSQSGKIRPLISDAVAINSRCKNKDDAFKFIKVLLSDDLQRSVYSDGYSINGGLNPVSISAFLKDVDKISSKEIEKLTMGEGINCIPLSDVLKNRLVEINEQIEEPKILDKSIKTIINSAVSDYLQGNTDIDQTAKLIDDKVRLFLNE